jgi:CBS domain containing-hemolysin-like protein
MLEFTTRQMKITRVYAEKLWLLSFFGSGLFCAVMIAAFLIAVFSERNGLPVVAALTTLVLVTVFSVGKAWLRLKAVKLVLTNYKAELRQQFWTQNTLWILSPIVFFYNSFAAWVSRRMTWRGTTYELISPTETVIITH